MNGAVPVAAESTTTALTAAGLGEALMAAFSAEAARDFDGTVRLVLDPGDGQPMPAAEPEAIVFRIDHGQIEPLAARSGACDITLYFHTADEALALLCGTANPVSAFMDGRFRSDGYLLWVFAVLSMFRGR
jgi:hypothetical protein